MSQPPNELLLNNALPEMTDAERYEFQSKRYGSNTLMLCMLKSGRIVLSNPLRDPIAIIKDWDHLKQVLFAAFEHAERTSYYLKEEAQRRRAAYLKTLDDEEELDEIKIDL